MKLRKANPDKNISILIYGRDGLGKSSFGSKFPAPIFVGPEIEGADFLTDINGDPVTLAEESTTHEGLVKVLKYLDEKEHEFKTVVLDSLDWMETQLQEAVKTKYKVDNLNDAAGGYGGGYRESFEMQVEVMQLLSRLKKKMNVIAVAHSKTTKFNDSITQAEYHKTELKLHESQNISPKAMWREAFDAVFLIDQDVEVEVKNNKTKTKFNSERILRCEGAERFDAKNRWPGFPKEIRFTESDDIFSIIKGFITKDFHKEALKAYEENGLDKPELLKYIEDNKADKKKMIAVLNKINGGK